jgi:hypothetical protein
LWCLSADDSSGDNLVQEVFTVEVCTSTGEVSVLVTHHNQKECIINEGARMEAKGLHRSDVGKDYIEVLLDGPERRLQRMDYIAVSPTLRDRVEVVSCTYLLKLPIYLSGSYLLQVTVVHSNITMEGIEPYRNYILLDRIYILNSAPVKENSMLVEETWAHAPTFKSPGMWVRRENDLPDHNFSEISTPAQQNANAHRCPPGGTVFFEWQPSPTSLGHSGKVLKEKYTYLRKEAMTCARRLSPKNNASYPKLVLVGDSLTRQTFNALSKALGLGDAIATKSAKQNAVSETSAIPGLAGATYGKI